MVTKPILIGGIATLILLVLGIGAHLLFFSDPEDVPAPLVEEESEEPVADIPHVRGGVIGSSVEGRPIERHTFGTGETHLLFVGGIHGGYEWNSVLLAYNFIDQLTADVSLVPANLTITIIPNLNPDGVYEVIQTEGRFSLADVPAGAGAGGAGRFNANNVDLNRNFACNWAPESSWRGSTVSAGTAPFSEPEAAALRDYVLEIDPAMVAFWHSQANTVYASECGAGVPPETRTIMNLYANAASYNAVESFDAYPITGDAEGWLASLGIPAITVELSSHESLDWQRNQAGVTALIDYYAKPTSVE